jgi:hypothetical protein
MSDPWELGPPFGSRTADLSPNNHGFAMASTSRGRDKSVTGSRKPLLAQAIDNNPTPSYLSVDLG